MTRLIEHRNRGASDPPTSLLESAGRQDREIDQTLADSFPASDPPPWTLGVQPGPDDEHDPGVAQGGPGSPSEQQRPGPTASPARTRA